MKIYIIGQVGSGKTTLAKKLAKKYNTESYELDKIVWDDDNNHIKRTNKEQIYLLNQIINKESWIIEDIGRKIFESVYSKCDYIYYLKLSPIRIYFRVIKRWIKQKLNIETYNYKPTLKSLIEMFSWLHTGLKNEKKQIARLKKYSDKLKILTIKNINY